MIKKRWWVWVISAILLGVLGAPQSVMADNGTDFSLQAELPANQVNGNATYFDVLVKPGTIQNTTVYVTNLSNQGKKIKLTPTNAKTFNNGEVSYAPNQNRDKSAQYQFTELTSPGVVVNVTAKHTVPVTFKTKIPATGFSGQILGGIYAVDTSAKTRNQKGVHVNNEYAYSIAVNLRTTLTPVAPKLELNTVRPGIESGRIAILANISNVTPRLFGKISYDSKVTKQGSSEVVMKRSVKNYGFAPNSSMDFATSPAAGKKLKAGDYTLDLTARSGQDVWHWQRNFTVKQAEINVLKEKMGTGNQFPWWLLVIVLLLVLLIIFLLILLFKRRKKDDDEETGAQS